MRGRRIIVGVTGGIAAYKAVVLIRELQKRGAQVRATLTPSALKFVGIETFLALTRHEVAVDVFNEGRNPADSWSKHIHWAEWADAVVVAPCTANSLAKIVHGLSDNLLTTLVMAARCPVVLCPTMDGGMYRSAAMQANLDKADAMGFHVMRPDSGYLASGLDDTGRLPEPDAIADVLQDLLSIPGPLAGRHVLVTAGPTREPIDAVRFISNPSSGKMGVAMAEAARDLGAEVTLVHGPLGVPIPDGVESVAVTTAAQMAEAVKAVSPGCAMIVMAAAVSDFRPVDPAAHKIKKSQAAPAVAFEPTEDILAWLGANRRDGQLLVGFAMETGDLIAEARRKRRDKNADWILANALNEPGSGFEAESNTLHAVGPDETAAPSVFSGSKRDVAVAALRFLISAASSDS